MKKKGFSIQRQKLANPAFNIAIIRNTCYYLFFLKKIQQ